MYNSQPTHLQNFWQNTSTLQKTTIFSIPIILIILIIVSLFFLNNRPINYDTELLENAKHVIIDNFDEITPNMPEFYKLETRSNLWINLRDYNNIPEDIYTNAEIRKDSYRVENDTGDNINTSSFIVDIPSLEQSFTISFSWLTNTKIPDEWLINISCPYYKDVIYSTIECKTSDNQIYNLSEYLPTKVDNIKLSIQKYNQYGSHPNQTYLSVDYETCDKSQIYYNNIKEVVYSWLKERYVNPDNFLIEYNPHCNNIQLIEGEPYED